jgi:hypothetical protein
MRTGKVLLMAAERALSAGNSAVAERLLREITELHPDTRESVAALSYLRSTHRRPQRRL